MNFKGHLTGGIISSLIVGGVGVYFHMPPPLIVGGCILSVVGALYPDMDIKSRSSIIVTLICLMLAGLMYLVGDIRGVVLITLLAIIPNCFPHRGPMHSYLVGFIVSCVTLLICNKYLGIDKLNGNIYICLAFYLGYVSHLVLDGIFIWG